jgi:Tfp pilus assembly protein PilO
VSRTFRILIVAVAAAGVVGGYWKLVLAPKRERAASLAKELSMQEAKAAQAQATLASYRQAKAAYKSNYATLVGLGKAVPKDDDTRSLVVQLDASAKRSGVDFDNIDVNFTGSASASPAVTAASTGAAKTPPGAISTGNFAVMPFTLSFTGRFDGLASFFSRLERFVTVRGDRIAVNGRLLRIESLTLQPADTGWPAVSAQIGAASYILPEGASQAAPAAPGTGTSTSKSSTTTASAPSTSGDLR